MTKCDHTFDDTGRCFECDQMSPSRQAKASGLKSLTQASQLLGTKPDGMPVVSLQTLTNWHKHKPKLFAVVLAGCKALNDHQDAPECPVKCNHDHCWKHLHMTGGYHLPGCQVREWQDEQGVKLAEQLLKSK